MNGKDSDFERLLRSARQTAPEEPASMPFGFDTRVVALWREGRGQVNGNGIARLIRRVAFAAVVLIIVSSTAAFREFKRTRDVNEPLTNEFAIADSAIQNELW